MRALKRNTSNTSAGSAKMAKRELQAEQKRLEVEAKKDSLRCVLNAKQVESPFRPAIPTNWGDTNSGMEVSDLTPLPWQAPTAAPLIEVIQVDDDAAWSAESSTTSAKSAAAGAEDASAAWSIESSTTSAKSAAADAEKNVDVQDLIQLQVDDRIDDAYRQGHLKEFFHQIEDAMVTEDNTEEFFKLITALMTTAKGKQQCSQSLPC